MDDSTSRVISVPELEEREFPVPSRGAGPAVRPVLIAAGGTGGHIMPAQAVAQAVRRLYPDVPVEFVCGMRPVELRAYWGMGEHPHLLRCGKVPGTGLGGLQRWIQLARAIQPAHRLVAQLKPQVVLGMGGYIVAPTLLAARRMNIPILLHESNAVAGRTTRLFSRWAELVFLAHSDARKCFPSRVQTRVVGTPVRPQLLQIGREAGAMEFSLDPSRRTLLVLGGSQGARAMNFVLLESLRSLDALAESVGGLQILWSTGSGNHSEIACALKDASLRHLNVRTYSTIQRMDAAYAASDLVLSRAGAGTLAEITALGLPSILVPYPNAKDDHQRQNARSLALSGATQLIEERQMTPSTLTDLLQSLLQNEDSLRRMSQAARTQAMPRAAEEVAEALIAIGLTRNPQPIHSLKKAVPC